MNEFTIGRKFLWDFYGNGSVLYELRVDGIDTSVRDSFTIRFSYKNFGDKLNNISGYCSYYYSKMKRQIELGRLKSINTTVYENDPEYMAAFE